MRASYLTIFFILIYVSTFALTKRDSVLNQLKLELSRKLKYDKEKLNRISFLKNKLVLNAPSQYQLYQKLFDEYEYYEFDSAYSYGQKILQLSLKSKDEVKLNESRVRLASLLLHAGMFKETFDYLKEIKVNALNNAFQYDYYCLKSGAYSNLAIYNNVKNFTEDYNRRAVSYLDSAISISAPNSFNLLFSLGNKQVVSGHTNEPPKYFLEILKRRDITMHQRARVLTGLAAFYQGEQQNDERVSLLAQSAICDIRSSIKETLATLLLAEDLFRHGDLNDAYLFIQHSRDDAGFYGNRLRKLKIESILPDIATQVNLVTQREKNKFVIYSLSISLIATIITFASFVIFIQLRKLKVKEQIIEQKNEELKAFNIQLLNTNDKLREYATVNERYTGYFIDVISGYILKLDKLKKNVERKLFTKRYDAILATLNTINIKDERETLFNTFDHVFMSIFPNFIEVFNSLFKIEDQILPKEKEILNTELRIFALTRLGISDVESIATILQYSVNTIYVYKMRIKAKSNVSNEEFDKIIMTIKVV